LVAAGREEGEWGWKGDDVATARHSTPFRCHLKHSSLIIPLSRQALELSPPVPFTPLPSPLLLPPFLLCLFCFSQPFHFAFLCCVSERFAAATHREGDRERQREIERQWESERERG